jgi:hypothetical protein
VSEAGRNIGVAFFSLIALVVTGLIIDAEISRFATVMFGLTLIMGLALWTWMKFGETVLTQVEKFYKVKERRNKAIVADLKKRGLEDKDGDGKADGLADIKLKDVLRKRSNALIFGEIGSGKSFMGINVIDTYRKIHRGRVDFIVLDAHARGDYWNPDDYQVLGWRNDFETVGIAINLLIEMLNKRVETEGEERNHLVVIIDEFLKTQLKLGLDKTLFIEMATSARHGDMSFVLMSQADGVEALGIPGFSKLKGAFAQIYCYGYKDEDPHYAITEMSAMDSSVGRVVDTQYNLDWPFRGVTKPTEQQMIASENWASPAKQILTREQIEGFKDTPGGLEELGVKTQIDDLTIKILRAARAGMTVADLKKEFFPGMNGAPKTFLGNRTATQFITDVLIAGGWVLDDYNNGKIITEKA